MASQRLAHVPQASGLRTTQAFISGHPPAVGCRKNYFQACAAFCPIRSRNGSGVLVHDPFRDGQTQPGSFGIQAAGNERLKDIRQNVGRNSGTIVFHS